jgi:opacity protein-like surface antigen
MRPLIAVAAWALFGTGMASAMELPAASSLPEASQVLGFYGSLSARQGLPSDFSVCFDPSPYGNSDCITDTAFTDRGLMFEASVGYAFHNGFRLEGEMSERRDQLNALRESGNQLGLDHSDARHLSLMLNGFYDFDTRSGLTPYVGAGIGGVHVEYGDAGLLGEGVDFSAEESAWKLGVQGFAGLQYEFSPDLRIGLRYSHKLTSKIGETAGFDSSADIGSVEGDSLRNRALMLTLTYEFGGP